MIWSPKDASDSKGPENKTQTTVAKKEREIEDMLLVLL